jgi:hypothetical protein
MTDTNQPRMTGPEIKQRQEEQARQEAALRQEQAIKATEEAKRQKATQEQAFAKKIKDEWYNCVQEATEQGSDIRFVVLASVIEPGGRMPPFLNEIAAEVAASMYRMELGGIDFEAPNGPRTPMVGYKQQHNPFESPKDPCAVYNGALRGWCPGSVPIHLAPGGGSNLWLLVRWD